MHLTSANTVPCRTAQRPSLPITPTFLDVYNGLEFACPKPCLSRLRKKCFWAVGEHTHSGWLNAPSPIVVIYSDFFFDTLTVS
jgi:hypothetical protein